MSKTSKVSPYWLFAMLGVVSTGAFLGIRMTRSRAVPTPVPSVNRAQPPDGPRPQAEPAPAGLRIKSAAQALRSGAGGDHGRRTLNDLRSHLAALPHEAAVAAIRAALQSGLDAPSGLGFKIGAGGGLAEAPSLRVFLLDQLAQMDPAVAVVQAREILAKPDSADEWAVALRCVARSQTDEAGHAFLAGKMRELLKHEPWQRDPSTGYLQAFDVAVHLRGTGLVPELAALIRRQDEPAVAHAAYLALDRLTITDPAPILAKLADDPGLMEGREATRANYFARADVSDTAQRAALERYLLDVRRTPEEVKTFTGLFPNANYMVSENLLTPVVTPDRAVLVARDEAALRTVTEWLGDPRFAALRPQLGRTQARLQEFARQAARP